jgi:hypothetical protein
MRPFGQRRSANDEVLFTVRYQDGRSTFIHVNRATAARGTDVVLDIAIEQQEQGALPAGTIIGVKRVR